MSRGTTKVLLVAVDGSDSAIAALKKAAAAATADCARLVVLAVTPRRLLSGPVTVEYREFARAEHLAGGEAEAGSFAAADVLKEAKETIGDCCGGVTPVYLSRAGNPTEEILACAEEQSADALYLGTRGLGSLGALFLGSVSQRVADAAGCPVVIVTEAGEMARRERPGGEFSAIF